MSRYSSGTVSTGTIVQPLGSSKRFLLFAVQTRQTNTLVRRFGTFGQILNRRPGLPPVGVQSVHCLLVGPDASRVRDCQIW